MRAAPAIAVRLDRLADGRWPLSLLAAFSAAAGTAAVLQSALPAIGAAWLPAALAAGLAVGALVADLCRPGQEVALRFDGGRWWWSEPAEGQALPVEVDVMLDLDRWMLLRLRDQGPGRGRRRHWVAVSARRVPQDWRAFRAALFVARPRPGATAAPGSIEARRPWR